MGVYNNFLVRLVRLASRQGSVSGFWSVVGRCGYEFGGAEATRGCESAEGPFRCEAVWANSF